MKKTLFTIVALLCFTAATAQESTEKSQQIQEIMDRAEIEFNNGNYEAAQEILLEAAELGDVDAIYAIAALHLDGLLAELDIEKAVATTQELADEGYAPAESVVGSLYAQGVYGYELDYAKAAQWYKKAADRDDASGQYGYGRLLCIGMGVEQDFNKAMEYLLKALDGGEYRATVFIGAMYGNGEGVEQDFAKANEYLEMGVENGVPDAMSLLGKQYLVGNGVETDYNKALELIRPAAEAGNAEGQYLLGMCYLNGYGVTLPSIMLGKKWLTSAAEMGHTEAIGVLESINNQ